MKFFTFLSATAKILLLSLVAVTTAYAGPSSTLPVLHINTENNAEITSKEQYVRGSYYLDPSGDANVTAIGSVEEPLPLQIRGRGNYTWIGFDKKPYRLKLDSKAALLGMKKSKHFALLAHADDNLGFMRNATGLELSRRMGLKWTPEAKPVEVVLNGDYIGLYFLTETIRVDKDRVNIVEQADNETDPEKITGGWLLEIDNYDTDPHVRIQENGGSERIIFTYKTPEALSQEQETYLLSQVKAMDKAIYTSDKSSTAWEDLIDIDQLARYYIVQEILDDCESFHGSCYLYKDLGEGEKWNFGPVWDFGNALLRGDKSKFIYDSPTFHQTWIGEIAKYPAFQNKVKEVWKEFAESGSEGFYDWIESEVEHISAAAAADGERWPQYSNADMENRGASFKRKIVNSINWLGKQWDAYVDVPHPTIYLRGTFNNWAVTHPFKKQTNGYYVIENIDIESDGTSQFKVATEDWKGVDLGATPNLNLEIGKVYTLTEKGENINLPRSIKQATMLLNPDEKTLLITDASGVGSVTITERGFSLSGRTLQATAEVSVYGVSGTKVWSGTGTTALLPAIYIVKTADGHVEKIIVK